MDKIFFGVLLFVTLVLAPFEFKNGYLREMPTLEEVQNTIEARDMEATEAEKAYLKKVCDGYVTEDYSCVSKNYFN